MSFPSIRAKKSFYPEDNTYILCDNEERTIDKVF